jgi:hypothetical protein
MCIAPVVVSNLFFFCVIYFNFVVAAVATFSCTGELSKLYQLPSNLKNSNMIVVY